MTAMSLGNATITLDPADGNGRNALLYGENQTVPINRIRFTPLTVDVVASWHRELDPTDVNGDGETTPRDALAVINLLAIVRDQSAVFQIDRSLFDVEARFDVIPDGIISPRDALVVINFLAVQIGQSEGVETISRDPLDRWRPLEVLSTKLAPESTDELRFEFFDRQLF